MLQLFPAQARPAACPKPCRCSLLHLEPTRFGTVYTALPASPLLASQPHHTQPARRTSFFLPTSAHAISLTGKAFSKTWFEYFLLWSLSCPPPTSSVLAHFSPVSLTIPTPTPQPRTRSVAMTSVQVCRPCWVVDIRSQGPIFLIFLLHAPDLAPGN